MAQWVPSNEDWDRYQDRIKQLYLVENKTLKEVMDFMETEYNFKATYASSCNHQLPVLTFPRVKMFKNRFTKWHFDQKYKKRDAFAPHNTAKRRASVGGLSTTHAGVLKHSSNSEPRVKRARTKIRSPSSPTVAAAGEGIAQIPQNPLVMSEASRIPRPVTYPEPLLNEISYYFCASFRSKMWVSDSRDKPCRSIKATDGVDRKVSNLAFGRLGAFGDHHLRILHMLERRSNTENFIAAEAPETIPNLIELSLRLIERGEYEVVQKILRQFEEVSIALKTKAASIYRILAQHSTRDSLVFEEAAAQAWRLVVAQFQCFLGDLHITTLRCHVRWLRYFADTSACDRDICSSKCEHVEYSKAILTDLLKSCEEDSSPESGQSEMVLQTMVNVLLAGGRYEEVEDPCRRIMDRTEMERGNHILITALEALSVAQCKQRKFSQAEQSLRKLVDLSAQSWGWGECRTLYYMDRLEDCLVKSGKGLEALKIWELRLDAPGRLNVPFVA